MLPDTEIQEFTNEAKTYHFIDDTFCVDEIESGITDEQKAHYYFNLQNILHAQQIDSAQRLFTGNDFFN